MSSRRRVLAGALGAATATLAGCVGGGRQGDDEPTDTEEKIHPDLKLDGTALSSNFPMKLVEVESGDRVVVIHWHGDDRHWHLQPLELPLDGSRSFRAVAVDRDRDEIPLGDDETYQLAVGRGEETSADLVDVEVVDDLVTIYGRSTGEGQLFVRIMQDGERVFLSPPIRTVVS